MKLDELELTNTEVKEEVTEPQQWTQERLSHLVGLPDASISDDNVISQAEFFAENEDPHESKTKRSFSSSPWSKGGLVYGGVGLVALVFGFMLTDIFNGSQQKKSQPENSPTEQVVFEEEEQNEEGHLKTQLALDDQAERMKEIEQSRSPKTKLELKDVQQEPKSSLPVERTSPRTVSRSSPPSSPPVRTRAVRVPVRTETGISSRFPPPSRVSGSPEAISKPQITPSVLRPRPPENPPSSEKKEEPIDPTERMAMLQSFGSYGGHRRSSAPREIPGVRLASSQEGSLPVTMPSPQRATMNRSVRFVSSDSDILASDEAALLGGQRRRRQFQVGSSAPAKLVTPVVWAEDLEGVEQHFVVVLTEPLSNSDGDVVLPAGSEVVFALEQVHESGLVLASGVSILVDGSEQPIPRGAITLNGSSGSPLAAERIQVGEGEIASRDLKMALFGALGNLGSVLNRPDSESRFSSATGGISSETTVRNGDPNIVGALLEGGLSPMVEQLISRNEAQIEELQERPGLWFLGAGREVEILVNQSF